MRTQFVVNITSDYFGAMYFIEIYFTKCYSLLNAFSLFLSGISQMIATTPNIIPEINGGTITHGTDSK